MAKVRNNATDRASGKVDQFVYRKRFGKTIMARKPDESTKAPSAEQLAVRFRFQLAIRYARMAKEDPELKALYLSRAKPGMSAYQVAVADYFDAPSIVGINTDDYTGNVGSKIVIDAFDQYKVAAVKVKITRADGSPVEQGSAVLTPGGLLWEYTGTVNNASPGGCIITVTAYDLPGNSTVEQKTL